MDNIREECVQFCMQHDEDVQILQLDFSQCYVYYMIDNNCMLEFIPGDDKLQPVRKHIPEILPAPDCTTDSFSRLLFKVPYGQQDIWVTVSHFGIKTLQARFRIPKYPSAATALILSKNIDMLNITYLSVVCHQVSDNQYSANGFFADKQVSFSWAAGAAAFGNQIPVPITYWHYYTSTGVLIITGTNYSNSDLFESVYTLRLDGTGHVSEQLFAGFCPRGQIDCVCYVFGCELSAEHDIRSMYASAYTKLDSIIRKWNNKIQQDQQLLYTSDIYQKQLCCLLSHQDLRQVFGKKTLQKLQQQDLTSLGVHSRAEVLSQLMLAGQYCSKAEQELLHYKGFDIFYNLINEYFPI